MGIGNQSKNQPPMVKGASNDFQTPPEALAPLFPFLDKNWRIWECAAGEGNLSREFKRRGYDVIGTDINHKDMVFRKDFLKWQPTKYDCIVTNPPYSIKQEFLNRCYTLEKPFALLLPLTTFETAKRQELFKSYGVQVIFFDRRINFKTPSGIGGGSWFSTAWFCWGLGLKKDMTFVKLGTTNTLQNKLDIGGK